MPQVQSDAIDASEKQRLLEDCIQIQSFLFVFQNTEERDSLRTYLVDTWPLVMDTFTLEIRRNYFPQETLKEIIEAEFVKLKEDKGEEQKRNTEERGMGRYHVAKRF
jgi:hypothetical protein